MKFNITTNDVSRGRKDYNEKFTKRREQIINLFNEGMTHKEIARIVKMYPSNVARFLKNQGYNIPNRSEIRRVIDENHFVDLNNKEVQYWIGMLATDGNLDALRNRIKLALKDEDHIIKFNKFLGNKLNINKDRKQFRLQYSNKEAYETLVSYGITDRKTYKLKLTIPITWDMLRGIIDGDGSYTKINNFGIRCSIVSASESFISQIENFLVLHEIDYSFSIEPRIEPLYVINIHKKTAITKLLNNIYNDATVYLERKYQRVLTLLDNDAFTINS